jgi:predicted amidophosphoribosyltransferase
MPHAPDLVAQALVRTRPTPPQSRLGAAARARNLTGAIAVRERYRRILSGASVVLFDDVVTTGATMAAAARALLDAGAREVSGVALARASASTG